MERTIKSTGLGEHLNNDIESIRETIQEVLVTTPNTITGDFQPLMQICLESNKDIKHVREELSQLKTLPQQMPQPEKGKMDALRREIIKELQDTTVETCAPIRTAIEKLRQEVRRSEEHTDTTKHGANTSHVDKGKQSYAEVLQTPRYSVIIESIDPRLSSNDVVKQVKSKVDVVKLGIGINAVRKLKNQRVAISCDTRNDREKLCKAVENIGDGLSVSQPKIKKPQLKLIGVANDLNDMKVEEAIYEQNASLLEGLTPSETAVRVLRRTKGRTSETKNIIMEASPQIWEKLRDRKIRLGFQVVHVVDQSPVIQCYRCLGYAHKATECRAPEIKCGYCAGDHDTRKCCYRNGAPKCANCCNSTTHTTSKQEYVHPAYSSECPEWQKWDRIARTAVNYC